jgi:glutathione-regulated potassium-efflux system protein KefB
VLVAAIAVALFRRFGLGSILGLLVTGVLVGPHTPGPSVTSNVEDLRHFTELGVVLLLFVIGLEMHPQRLWAMRRSLFGLGSLQILISGLLIAGWFRLFQPDWGLALLFGLSLALSSTALVVQTLHEQGRLATTHGQTAFSVLLMQDIAVVPLIALLPVLAHTGPLSDEVPLWEQIGIVVAMIGLVLVVGYWVVPKLLDLLAADHNREAFLLIVLAAVLLAAWAMDQAGMSMALGAFLMGVMLSLSGSKYSLLIEASVEPHKGLLMSLFFVAVGMSLDLGVVAEAPGLFGLHVLAITAVKILVLVGLCLLFGIGRGDAIRVGFLLAQAGEFGFVVFGAAKVLGIIDDRVFITAVAIISLTILLTPVLIRLSEAIAGQLPESQARVDPTLALSPETKPPAQVIIGGYGRVGHAIGMILEQHGIAFLAFEADPELVRYWREKGYPVFYGDIRDPNLLDTTEVNSFSLVVLTIDDAAAAVRATEQIRARAPNVPIIARARDLTTCGALQRAGATDAFPETQEAALRLGAVTLQALGIGSGQVESLVAEVRDREYVAIQPEPEQIQLGVRVRDD